LTGEVKRTDNRAAPAFPNGSILREVIRASDTEREQVARSLGSHLVAGRLNLDEFSLRVERAYTAETLDDLRALTSDLGVALAAPQARRKRRPWWPGNVPFITQFDTSQSAATVVGEAMKTIVPRLVAAGYHVETREERLVILSKGHRPAWTIVLSVFLFPLGLLALLHQERCQVVISAHGGGRTTTVEVAGTAPLPIRRAASALSDV
jgi:uncharacterized protein DUF1707